MSVYVRLYSDMYNKGERTVVSVRFSFSFPIHSLTVTHFHCHRTVIGCWLLVLSDGFVVRRSPFAVRSFAVRRSPFAFRRSPFAVRRSSKFVEVRRSSLSFFVAFFAASAVACSLTFCARIRWLLFRCGN